MTENSDFVTSLMSGECENVIYVTLVVQVCVVLWRPLVYINIPSTMWISPTYWIPKLQWRLWFEHLPSAILWIVLHDTWSQLLLWIVLCNGWFWLLYLLKFIIEMLFVFFAVSAAKMCQWEGPSALYNFASPVVCITCSTHIILLGLITPMVFGVEHKL